VEQKGAGHVIAAKEFFRQAELGAILQAQKGVGRYLKKLRPPRPATLAGEQRPGKGTNRGRSLTWEL